MFLVSNHLNARFREPSFLMKTCRQRQKPRVALATLRQTWREGPRECQLARSPNSLDDVCDLFLMQGKRNLVLDLDRFGGNQNPVNCGKCQCVLLLRDLMLDKFSAKSCSVVDGSLLSHCLEFGLVHCLW